MISARLAACCAVPRVAAKPPQCQGRDCLLVVLPVSIYILGAMGILPELTLRGLELHLYILLLYENHFFKTEEHHGYPFGVITTHLLPTAQPPFWFPGVTVTHGVHEEKSEPVRGSHLDGFLSKSAYQSLWIWQEMVSHPTKWILYLMISHQGRWKPDSQNLGVMHL